ncbi:MAG: hypothetical protein H0T79_08660 [Deltaproteobacteria bacterium]|nr:hypothetical protein [Deltaproteobacteria bacterium]
MVLSPSYLLAACVLVGGYLLVDGMASPGGPAIRNTDVPARAAGTTFVAPRAPAIEPVVEPEPGDDSADDAMRGHPPIEDPAELAFVFSVDGVSYVRLSTEESASARGDARLIEEDGVHAVVAPVATAALPANLWAWAGRNVLVDGTCHARVIGFAEVSRVTGESSELVDLANERHESISVPERSYGCGC